MLFINNLKFFEDLYNDSLEKKEIKDSVQQELPKIIDYLCYFDENFKNKILTKFSSKEKLDEELQFSLNCFNVSINILGLYFEDEAIETDNEISYLVNKIFQYVDEFHRLIDKSMFARRITEVLLYCLCNIDGKINLNKIVNYKDEYLQICFKNEKNFPLLKLSSAIISAFLISRSDKILDDLLKYLEDICVLMSNNKEKEYYGIDNKLIENAYNFLNAKCKSISNGYCRYSNDIHLNSDLNYFKRVL